MERRGPEGTTWHIGRLQTVYPPVGAVGNGHKQRDWKPGNHGGIFFDNNKERDMNDILDRDYEMGIPFDVDENNECAWARMDENYDDGGDDE